MRTNTHSIHEVLCANTTFYIPPFQRAYAWGRQEIERYFNDIARIIDSELDSSQNDKLEHFFGTLVIKMESQNMLQNRTIVIDGQQRLTTTLLFCIALRDLDTTNVHNSINETYLKSGASEFSERIKLKQVTADWEAYKVLVIGNAEQLIPGKISSAYSVLKKLISNKKSSSPKIDTVNFIAALKKLNISTIELDERPHKGENPQIIFETLNSLGKPLTLSDLIRNFILLDMNSNQQSNTYESVWHPKIENVLLDATSNFFRDYLQYKLSTPLKVVSDNNTKELYFLFKQFVNTEFASRDEFVKDIVSYVQSYNYIITEINAANILKNADCEPEIKKLVRNIFHDIKAEAFKPLVLGLLSSYQQNSSIQTLNCEVLVSTLTQIRTYLIRRRLLGLTQGENKNIVLLCKEVPEITSGVLPIMKLLTNLFYNLRLPNDEEITNELKTMNLYLEKRQYLKFILGVIEEKRTKVSVDFRDSKITIEHIMPQTLDSSWRADLGLDHEEVYKKYLHNIGNLILTEFNSENGNKPFDIKKQILRSSSLSYRLDVIEKHIWNLDSIIQHQSNMINRFLETFDLPLEHRSQSNWNTNIANSDWFSAKDKNLHKDVKGQKPSKLFIFNDIIEVKTWQELYIRFIKFVMEEYSDGFSDICNNQSVLFNNDGVFLTRNSLKLKIAENDDLADRYKNVSGQKFRKAKNISENELFIHINISAERCLDRISVIMTELNMSSDDILIKFG